MASEEHQQITVNIDEMLAGVEETDSRGYIFWRDVGVLPAAVKTVYRGEVPPHWRIAALLADGDFDAIFEQLPGFLPETTGASLTEAEREGAWEMLGYKSRESMEAAFAHPSARMVIVADLLWKASRLSAREAGINLPMRA